MRRLLVLAAAALGLVTPSAADILPRGSTPAGSVIARKTGEEARFIEIGNWRTVDIKQDLLAGDTLRTNAHGQLAILFSDRTQVRLGRNTTLVVKAIGKAADTVFSLRSGALWARAERGGLGLTVETPAAAAAIRGTDWTMTVDAGGKTSLIVLEGLVQLSNLQGSVSVAAGEAAVASIGQAPTKLLIVDPKDREQMLFYLSLRNSFTWMPASPLPGRELRAERAHVMARPADARTARDWTLLAEAALSNDGEAAATNAVAHARALHPSRSQEARLDLVDAMLAGARRDYEEAARLFARAFPHLDRKRRAIALYGGYYARALADPDRTESEPRVPEAGPYGAMAKAWTAGFLLGIRPAIEIVKEAERRYPNDPSLPAMRAKLAILIDDGAQVEEAFQRALSLDPEDPDALEARALYRADFKSDLEGALGDLEHAAEIQPGSSDIWNEIALVQTERGALREAEAAYRRAIAIDPDDPVPHANLAIFLLDQDRLREAKKEIDTAIALDPSFEIGLVARGRYYLQTGENEKAMADLLAGTTANPAYAQGLLLLAAVHYQSGERVAATQAMDNADRLDPNDPVTTSFRTALAIDDYDAEKAVESAQESLRRARARGGDYAALSANRDEGSTLNDAFRLAGLDAWGRYYGDAVFDPFSGASLVDQSVSGSPDAFVNNLQFGGTVVDPTANGDAFSSFFQGLMLAPEMLSGRSRSANLLRSPFVEGMVGGGFVREDGWNGQGEAEIQGFVANPFPWSFYGNLRMRETGDHRERLDPGSPFPFVGFDLEDSLMTGAGYITARPTPYDRMAAYFNYYDSRARLGDATIVFSPSLTIPIAPGIGLPIDALTYDRTLDTTSWTAGAGWSHTFGYRNVMNAAVFASGLDQTSHEEGALFTALPPPLPPLAVGVSTIDRAIEQNSVVGALNHTVGVGDVTWRYGVEGGTVAQTRSEINTIGTIFTPPTSTTDGRDIELAFGRAYVDALYELTPDLKLEGALFGTWLGDPLGTTRVEPRAGIAWSPADGQWLRAGFVRETFAIGSTTLAPIGVVGLQANQLPLDVGGYSDTYALRWDAEWTNRFFTSLDYQHQEIHDLSLPIPGGLETIDIAEGRIDRVAATADLRLGHGFGAFATFAYTGSENRDPATGGFSEPLPYIPETSARFGLTWVHPSNVKLTLAESYVGARAGDVTGTQLDGYWSTDAFLTWEPLDKRFSLELAAYNLLDEQFEVATSVPGWGRTFTGLFKVRF